MGSRTQPLYLAWPVRALEIPEMRRLRQLEEENRRLKAIVADQALDIRALKDLLAKTDAARGETRDGGGSHDHPCFVGAAPAEDRNDGVTRVLEQLRTGVDC
jgi:hypothetical protein